MKANFCRVITSLGRRAARCHTQGADLSSRLSNGLTQSNERSEEGADAAVAFLEISTAEARHQARVADPVGNIGKRTAPVPLRIRDSPFGMPDLYFGVFKSTVRVDGRDAEVQFVVGGHGLDVVHFISKEDAKMRAPGDEIPHTADAAAQGAVGKVRRDRNRSFILVN